MASSSKVLDLVRYVGQTLSVKRRNGSIVSLRISASTSNPLYPFQDSSGGFYTPEGCTFFGQRSPDDIVKILGIRKPGMGRTELRDFISQTEEYARQLKLELSRRESCPTLQEASEGDVLEDDSIVLLKCANKAILVSPSYTETEATWSDTFLELNDSLKEGGFNPSEWFVPNKSLLHLAMTNHRRSFGDCWYWSSSEIDDTRAEAVDFRDEGSYDIHLKSYKGCVRAFRSVYF